MKSAEEKMKINDLKNKYLSLFLTALFMLVMFFSASYIAEEMIHDCSGEECPICECIHMCECMLYETSGAVNPLIVAAVVFILVLLMGRGSGYILLYDTPVSEKVRMDS